jgi:hypothetical protein
MEIFRVDRSEGRAFVVHIYWEHTHTVLFTDERSIISIISTVDGNVGYNIYISTLLTLHPSGVSMNTTV